MGIEDENELVLHGGTCHPAEVPKGQGTLGGNISVTWKCPVVFFYFLGPATGIASVGEKQWVSLLCTV